MRAMRQDSQSTDGVALIIECEKQIRDRLVIDETSPSGLRWSNLATPRYRGKVAGAINSHGYWQVSVGLSYARKLIKAHRIVWLLANGCWPKEQIDHINGNRADNRISNLREASNVKNAYNRAAPVNNSSGVKGVTFDKGRGKWMAQLKLNGKNMFLGRFVKLADAECSVIAIRERLHGEFANHGANRKAHK